jgi:aspartyl-tRNA(Asn)/glutamyl-tRNA(Gln) amidotransferase subunit C
MKITRDEARRIAALAHLEFDDDALDRLAAEMTKILGYIDQLRQVEGEDEGAVESPIVQSLRDDATRPGIDRTSIAANAPDFENGFFIVPKVIE